MTTISDGDASRVGKRVAISDPVDIAGDRPVSADLSIDPSMYYFSGPSCLVSCSIPCLDWSDTAPVVSVERGGIRWHRNTSRFLLKEPLYNVLVFDPGTVPSRHVRDRRMEGCSRPPQTTSEFTLP